MECSKLGIEVSQYKVYERSAFLTAVVSGPFRDRYWGRAGLLLASFFPVPTYSPTSLCEVNTT